jgi:hypothetical protein
MYEVRTNNNPSSIPMGDSTRSRQMSMDNMEATKDIEARAAALGKAAGLAAAAWYFDGATDDDYRATLGGMLYGDPEVLDTFPGGWLSNDLTPESLMRELGVDPGTAYDALVDAVCQRYEEAANDASYAEIERLARYHTEGEHFC